MSINPKFNKEIKIKACQDYLSANGSYTSIALNIGTDESTVRWWCKIYQNHGEDAFDKSPKNRSFSKEFKQSVVDSYIYGEASILDLCGKYSISSSVLRKWLKKYYNGIDQTDYDPKGEVYTMKSRQTTSQEQREIVKWVLDHNMNYKGAADKYQIKYSLVYSWVRKYLKYGEGALVHKKRGPKSKNTIDVSNMGETERLKHELEHEKALRKRVEFELEVLKKKEEIEKKLRFRK